MMALLLSSIATVILGRVPTEAHTMTIRIDGVDRQTVRFTAPGVASVELCAACGQRAWIQPCGCGH